MKHHYFPVPPATLTLPEQTAWHERLRNAEDIVGISQTGVPTATAETIALLERYVVGELTLEQIIYLQQTRLNQH